MDAQMQSVLVRYPMLMDLATSGVAVSWATACTNPIDVVKIRLQLQQTSRLGMGGPAPPGLLMTGVNMVRHEGAAALLSGMTPAVARGLTYGGVRLGLYTPLKDGLKTSFPEGSSLAIGVTAGILSGAVAAGALNPFDLIKTRLQAKDAPFKTPGAVVRNVLANEGVLGFWRGTVPSMARAGILTAAQCATYDEVKQAWMRMVGAGDTFGTHLGASMVTGLVSTTVTAPVDVIKTHMFVAGNRFTGPLQCAAHIMQTEGLRGMFKGWTANYARLGPHTTLIFLGVEFMRKITGMSSF